MKGKHTGKRKFSLTSHDRQALRTVNNMLGAGRGISGNPLSTALHNRISSLRSIRSASSTRTQIVHGTVEQEGVGGSLSKTYLGKKTPFVPKSVLRTLAPLRNSVNGAAQLIAGVGVQNAISPLILWNVNDLATLMTRAGKTTTAVAKLIAESVYAECVMTNCFKSNCFVTIYDCIARKDIGSNNNTPLQSWSTGDSKENASSTITTLGQMPFESESFNQFWKVVRQTKVTLAQGATHRHCVSGSPNRTLSSTYTDEVYGVKGLTYGILIIIHGQPANDSVTQTQVRLGSAGLNIVYRYEYDFKSLDYNLTNTVYTNNLGTSFTTAEQMVDPGSGEVETNAEG